VESEDPNMNDPYELSDIEDKVEVALEYIERVEVIQNMLSITEFLNTMQEEVTDSAEHLEVYK